MTVPVSAFRERALRLFDRHSPAWAVDGDDDAVLNVPLHPPTEQAALADLTAAREWVETWKHAEARLPLELEWAARSWARVGTQLLPVRAVARGGAAIAQLANRGPEWRDLSKRIRVLRTLTGTGAEQVRILRSHARLVAKMEDVDFSRLLDVLVWLRSNPDSNHLVRELPIRGIDTKWVGQRRRLVESLHTAVTGRIGLGLREPPTLIRVRLLDPAYTFGGLRDITAPVADLAQLPFTPERVFVFENLNTLLAMPDTRGAVVLDGGGHRVNLVAQLPWAVSVTYWGDLDSHGFAILHRLRSHGVHATSALMDRETLNSHLDLCGVDPSPNTGVFDRLTGEEQATLSLLSSKGNIRLEQERIPWDYALPRLV